MIEELDFIALLLTIDFVLSLVAIFYLKGKIMSAGSNLKDAVVMLQNSAAVVNAAIVNHVAVSSSLTPDADVQAAADAINAAAVSLTQAASQLK